MRFLAVLIPALLGALPLDASGLLNETERFELAVTNKVDAEVIEALDLEPRVRAIVLMRDGSSNGLVAKRFESPGARDELRALGDRLLARMPEGELGEVRRYRSIAAMAVETSAAGLRALAADATVAQVGLAAENRWSLVESLPLANIPSVRKPAKNGKGVWVAVLDSGTDTNHKDIKKPLKKQECFCIGCCPDGSSRQSGRGSAEDDVGHGTLVSGTIVSRGKVAPRGVAHKAKLLMVKMGGQTGPDSSDAIAALDYILTDMPEVEVINMSFGSLVGYGGNCDSKGATNKAYSALVEGLRENGTLLFAASGNDGTPGKMSSPACIKDVISVGAVYDQDFGVNLFNSCTDPAAEPNSLVCWTSRSKKTDLVAPGYLITLPAVGGGASSVVGTSFASPMAAGCGALLQKLFPDATPKEIEQALLASPTSVPDPENNRSYPALDCQAAMDQLEES